MTRHRKRPNAGTGKPNATTVPPVEPTPAKRASQKRGTSRIEARGVDLELVAASVAADFSAQEDERLTAMAVIESTAPETEITKESEALREELVQIGVALDLPTRRRVRAVTQSSPAVYAGAPFNFKKALQRLAPVVVFVGIMCVAATFRKPAAPTLPDDLLGTWATSNAAYQGRELGFVDAELVMRVTPDAELTRYPITAMKSRILGDTTVLGLTYETEGGPMELHAKLVGGPQPKLVFDRPSGLVWERRVN